MCVHSVDGGKGGLHSQLFVCVQHILALLKESAPIALTFRRVKQRLMAWVCG